MKKWIALASVAALAACNQAEAPAEEVAAEPEVVAMAGGAGVYEVATEDGGVAQTIMLEDGTYSDKDPAGNTTETGTWKTEGDRTCFDPEGDDPEYCFTNGPMAEDGAFTVTPDGSEDSFVVKRMGDVPAE